MTREELRDYVEEQRSLGVIPYHVYSTLIDGIDTLEQEPKTENKGKWIPVSERLPKEEGRYLCTVGAEYRKVREMYYAPQPWADKSKKVTWRSIDGAYVYDWFIEAWQPLPEPYKAEKGGE